MAFEFVTTEEAAAQLRLDDAANDLWLEVWIPAISEAVASWLKDDWRCYVPEEDSNGVMYDSNDDPIPSDVVRPAVKAAVLIELASQFRFREGESTNAMPSHEGHGYALCRAATSLLAPLRKTTVA